MVKQTKICLAELITKLLELGRNLYWCTGRRLKCHTGRYGSLGRIVARSCACGQCSKRTTVFKQGKCSGSSQVGFEETFGFGPSCASDGEKNWKIKRDSAVVDKKILALFVIDTHCERRKVNNRC